MTQTRTRFAPSPTGYLHIGGARTALFNWLLAKAEGGVFVLRIEDTDRQRSTQESIDAILEAMDWLGLDYDEGPFFQSQRTEIHLEYINKLLESGKAYYCYCPPEELDRQREAARAAGRKPRYDGTCREKGLGPGPGAVVRFKNQHVGTVNWKDLVKGPIAISADELDDLVLLKSDGMPTYNMAVVVDDLTMGITQVIRGDDHINNTPRQILIYEALGAALPEFGHVPMILGADKSRLSKRHGATSVMAYQELGYLPEAMVNYLVRLGWSYGDEEIFSRADLIEKFSLENVGKSAGIFDQEKLNWLNAHYIKEAEPQMLIPLVRPFLENHGMNCGDDEYLGNTISTLQPRSKTLDELALGLDFYLNDEIEYEEKAARKNLKKSLMGVFSDMVGQVSDLDFSSEEAIEKLFRDLAEKHEIKLGKIAQPVRVALTGKTASPGLFEVMHLLGKDRVMARLEKAKLYLENLPEID